MTSVKELLDNVTAQLPGGGESRPGQVEMGEAVAAAVANQKTVLVEAGTGTGKSFAYLTPAIAGEKRTVVATATIALQAQLVEVDIPRVASGIGREVSVALLKGRRNYLCRQQLSEIQGAKRAEQMDLLRGRNPDNEFKRIAAWAEDTATGDREELHPAPASDVWSAVSVSSDECPGAARCPVGIDCFAEQAKLRAMDADVVVTNHHYYGLHLASGGALLPDHEAVVFDEAHQLPEILGATCGTEIGGGRLRAMARRARAILTDESIATDLDKSAMALDEELRTATGNTIAVQTELLDVILTARQNTEKIVSDLRKVSPPAGSVVAARVDRSMQAATRLINDCDSVIGADPTDVVWVDGTPSAPVLRRTPLELGDLLEEHLWPERAVVLTSATLSDGVATQLGLDATHTVNRVGSPFAYEELGLLYCPTDLPNPNSGDHRRKVQDEIIGLAKAAGGRMLCLFTSYSAMEEAAERFEDELGFPLLVQGAASKGSLIQSFKDDPKAVLAATMSFWQGIDLPGDTLTVVTIDRLPFPRPNEPVAQARRDRAGSAAFRVVDLPRAQTLLAQAAGRLVRSQTDRGVVAVLDPRLATSKAYRWDLINALPPFRRTKDRSEVLAFLAELDREATGGNSPSGGSEQAGAQ